MDLQPMTIEQLVSSRQFRLVWGSQRICTLNLAIFFGFDSVGVEGATMFIMLSRP